ncbi:uncharacterized protein LOC130725380 [Lotus japonicus]|uniref:uncharacterized protein LOC130725380 n=1 Tax=Lotus japonicus TaxID=34305 RepID=UPI00258AC688|nr:uncharacterized protein LOC130725380 [Lotus japonicus]
MVEEIGEHNVVQVVTDGASNLVAAGRLLEEKRTKHTWVLSLYRDFCDGELARPAVTRFATAYLTLQCMKQQKNGLRSMFASEKWANSNYASRNDAKKVVDIVLSDSRFWRSIQYCLKCVTPLVAVLRLVDGDAKPAMPYIYEAMDRAKEQIVAGFNNEKSRYMKVWKLIDTRWNFQLHRPLHAAAYYLNPKYHYQKNFNPDNEVLYGVYDVIHKMAAQDSKTRVLIDRQLEQFKGARGLFGVKMAVETRNVKHALWWESYGRDGNELQKIAMRILSPTCSATGCERNWSVFYQIHTKRRNKLEQQRLNALVYVKYNLQLEMRQKTREEKGDNYDPICLSDIESDDEWITEKETPCLPGPGDDSWMDIHESFTLEEGAPSKKRKRGPRNLNARSSMGKGKSICEDESEVEEIIAMGEEGGEQLENEEDDLSDVDLGDD